jgi:tetratricopeptide (TPR) repeat protein
MRALLSILLIAMAALSFPLFSAASNSQMESIDYWQSNYDQLRPENDQQAKRAYEIFDRLIRAAGSRPGLVPRLFIAKTEPRNISLPISIPDGSIIISKRTLEICAKDPGLSDDRLAFVLGHELAHLLKDDFWHMKFFSALKSAEKEKPSDAKLLSEIKEIVGATDQVLAKELQADEFGIIYASMAGFNSNAIVTDENVNFFAEWLKAADPEYSESAPKDPTHPTPEQRAQTVKTRLRQVMKNVEVFELGVALYRTGQFELAIPAFERFLTYFPSREVYNNLAACHHQLALKYLRHTKSGAGPLFKMSLTLDPQTRASGIVLRGKEDPVRLSSEQLQEAIDLYEKAISLDTTYLPSRNNLACALILRGREGDAYKAVGILKDSIRIGPPESDTLNILGVAFYYAENPSKAKECFLEALRIDPADDSPLFNLGRLAFETGQQDECRQYWSRYLELDKSSHWAGVVRKLLNIENAEPASPASAQIASVRPGGSRGVMYDPASGQGKEKVLGIEAGASDEGVPKDWGEPKVEDIALEGAQYRISSFPNQLKTVSANNEIQLIVVQNGFAARTAKDVGMGSSKEDVLSRYGAPDLTLNSSRGVTIVYDELGISFDFREGKLVSWVVF